MESALQLHRAVDTIGNKMFTPTSRTPSVIALLLGAAVLLATGWASADPPVRVMRLGYIDGPVSFSPAGEDEWVQASVNRPLTGGDRLWVDAGARAELQVGQIALRADGGTSVSLLNLDDRVTQVELVQGTLDIRVRHFAAGDVLEIDTPNLAFSILRAGSYRIEVDPARGATAVMTRSGQAEVYGESAGYVVDAGKAYRFYGSALAATVAGVAPAAAQQSKPNIILLVSDDTGYGDLGDGSIAILARGSA